MTAVDAVEPIVRCVATSSRTGQPCRNRPMPGTTVCRSHGGLAPQVKRAAARRLAEAEARRFLSEVDVVPIGNPVDELFDLAAKVKAMLGFVHDHVAAVDIEEWQSFTSEKSVQLSVYVGLLRDLQVQLERSLVNIVKLSQDERLVRLREREGAAILWVMYQLIERMGLDPEMRKVAEHELPALLDRASEGSMQ